MTVDIDFDVWRSIPDGSEYGVIPVSVEENFAHFYILDNEDTLTDAIGDGPDIDVDGPTLVEDDDAPFGGYLDFDSNDELVAEDTDLDFSEVSVFVWYQTGQPSGAKNILGVSTTEEFRSDDGWHVRDVDGEFSWVIVPGIDSLEVGISDESEWLMNSATYSSGTSNIYAYQESGFEGDGSRSADYELGSDPDIFVGDETNGFTGNIACFGIVEDELDKDTFDDIFDDTTPD